MIVRALRPARQPVSAFMGPKDFHWLIPGRLGGSPRPGGGFAGDVDGDLEALRRVKTVLLVNLTEESGPADAQVRAAGLKYHRHRIPDMGAPTPEDAAATCALVGKYLNAGKACVYHCHAGKGRTGTMLAAQLIYFGADADGAITQTRARNPKWIESQAQLDFLHRFAEYMSMRLAVSG